LLPRIGADRLGPLPADENENWLNDEIVAGIAPSFVHRHLPNLPSDAAGRGGEAEDPVEPVRAV
jgi:hypothetical protein